MVVLSFAILSILSSTLIDIALCPFTESSGDLFQSPHWILPIVSDHIVRGARVIVI